MCGLTLPKIVVSNRLTREQGISGMNIVDVPLCKVISGGVNNWALRQVAHGRTVQWENFRSRQEAIFLWSVDASIALRSGTNRTARILLPY